MRNARSGSVLTFILFTLMLCACATMALAVFMMKEKGDHYRKMVPIIKQNYEKEKLNYSALEKDRIEIKEERDRLKKDYDEQVKLNEELQENLIKAKSESEKGK
ncbi:MAG: hypothetical protein E3J72_15035 [Planctomycetota bacterium]|nr:MAG: hypothetical protein E3J72_15035 [Planctomycetota bacterium]